MDQLTSLGWETNKGESPKNPEIIIDSSNLPLISNDQGKEVGCCWVVCRMRTRTLGTLSVFAKLELVCNFLVSSNISGCEFASLIPRWRIFDWKFFGVSYSYVVNKLQIVRDGFDSRLEQIVFDVFTGWLPTRRVQAHFAVSLNYCSILCICFVIANTSGWSVEGKELGLLSKMKIERQKFLSLNSISKKVDLILNF